MQLRRRDSDWVTDALTDIVENPLRDGHARVMAAYVRIQAGDPPVASACPAGATFTTEAPGAYNGFEMPCDAVAERAAIDLAPFGFAPSTVVKYSTGMVHGLYIMVYHAGLNDTSEAIEQIDRLARPNLSDVGETNTHTKQTRT